MFAPALDLIHSGIRRPTYTNGTQSSKVIQRENMRDLALDDFKKLPSDKKSMELFRLLIENNRMLKESPSSSASESSNVSAKYHQTKSSFKFSPKFSRRDNYIFKIKTNQNNHSIVGGNAWKNALNLNSDLHDPWINLFKALYGDDYFDRIRSLAKSKSETAIINVGGERHEVMQAAL